MEKQKKLTAEQIRAWEAGRDARQVELHERIKRIEAELAAKKKPA
jgi:hypothetical protein